MFGLRIAGVACVLIATSAFGHDVRHERHQRRHVAAAPYPAYEAQSFSNQPVWAQAPAPRLHVHGNSCAPDRAEPVWGEGNAFMGYSCVPESANGG